MTNISIRKSKTGLYEGFTVLGHAGYAQAGDDIVCAAISVLVINTINAIDILTEDEPKVISREAEGLIDCRFSRPIREKANLLIEAMVLGLQQIKQQYGNTYMDLTIEEV